MYNITKNKQEEILHTQVNADENQNNIPSGKQLLEREKITDTPFELIGNEEIGYFISLGKYRISEIMTNKKIAIESLEKEQWNYIVRIIVTLIEDIYDNKIQESAKK